MSKILLLIEFWSDDRDWLNKEMDDDQVMKQCLPLVLFKLLGKFCDNVVKVFVFKMDTAAKVRSATRMMPYCLNCCELLMFNYSCEQLSFELFGNLFCEL